MTTTPDTSPAPATVGLTASALARLFDYPSVLSPVSNTVAQRDEGMAHLLDLPDAAERIALIATLDCPDLAPGFIAFAEAMGTMTPAAREELYSATFDFDPAVSLELGWHLFGESYKRGAFLVRMRKALREHGIDEGRHLPDFLPTLLRLLDELEQEDGEALILEVIIPALEVVLNGFESRADHPYFHALRALQGVLTSTVADALDELEQIRADTVRVAEAEAMAHEQAAATASCAPVCEGGPDV
ncbi:MAG: nitrate reductase molybdenum cofactor assembly chaperone [Planctomycetota bacterium]